MVFLGYDLLKDNGKFSKPMIWSWQKFCTETLKKVFSNAKKWQFSPVCNTALQKTGGVRGRVQVKLFVRACTKCQITLKIRARKSNCWHVIRKKSLQDNESCCCHSINLSRAMAYRLCANLRSTCSAGNLVRFPKSFVASGFSFVRTMVSFLIH